MMKTIDDEDGDETEGPDLPPDDEERIDPEEARRVCDQLGVDLDALHRRILAMVDAHEAAARAPESGPRPTERPPDPAEGAAASERGEPSAQVLSIAAVRTRGARPWLAAGVAVCAVAAAAVAAIRARVPAPPLPAAREGLSATMSVEPALPGLPDAGSPSRERGTGGGAVAGAPSAHPGFNAKRKDRAHPGRGSR